MKIVSNITKILGAGLLAVTLAGAAVQPARASLRPVRSHSSSLLFKDGQETHGGPRRALVNPTFGDGQETHGGPR